MTDPYNQLIGVLNVESPLKNAFSRSDVEIFRNYANQASAVLYASQQRKIDETLIQFGHFSRNVVHRISNLLGSIPADLKLIIADMEDNIEENKKEIRKIRNIVMKSNDILTGLKEAAELGINAYYELPEIVRVNELLQSIAANYPVQKKEINVDLKLSESDPKILVPSGPILDALTNVFMNSIQILAETNGGTIELKSEKNGNIVIVTITDDGPGVHNSVKDSLFEFGVTSKDDGTGFGLWSARNAIEVADGKISLEENYDEGARFIITFREAEIE
jgi:signal transduction histidine kinase